MTDPFDAVYDHEHADRWPATESQAGRRHDIDRRSFLASGAVAAASIAVVSNLRVPKACAVEAAAPRIRKAVKYHMILEDLSLTDKLKLLKDVGFDGVELRTRDNVDHAQLLKASESTGVPVHGIINSNDPDIRTAIDLATRFGGDSVLVVAGRVNKETSYDANYGVWQDTLKANLPYAEDHGIRLLVENVWNNFLLSPLEMARFIDELQSPMAGVYFDVGNVVRFGWPQHWIRILGRRIGKLDIKEYSRTKQKDEGLWKGFDVEIGDGDCDWPDVRSALHDINYTTGWATAEVPGGDRDRLAFIAERMDRVLALKAGD